MSRWFNSFVIPICRYIQVTSVQQIRLRATRLNSNDTNSYDTPDKLVEIPQLSDFDCKLNLLKYASEYSFENLVLKRNKRVRVRFQCKIVKRFW